MSKWDELEKATIAARDMLKSHFTSQEELNFREMATPEAVLSLIEQNREMLEALEYVLETCPAIDPSGEDAKDKARSAIRKATGEEE
ncbi:hypothetical protein [Pseudomonas tohonis]|uniref:hypothetical protein n=1 Tax=Pseudomonas tohonis TaxID=2725477 RepID=UPI001F372866|nr:hypothetical protein [Pseudomonas tohonis]